MTEHEMTDGRISAHPWSLYQADHLAELRAKSQRSGMFSWWLRDDLSNKRFGYDVNFVPTGASFDACATALFELLDDFNQHDYDRNPTDVIFALVDRVLDDSADAGELFFELFQRTAPQRRRARSRRQAAPQGAVEEQLVPALGYIPPWSITSRRRGALQVAPVLGAANILIPSSRLRRLVLSSDNLSAWRHSTNALRKVDQRKVLGDRAGLERLGWEGYAFKEHAEAENLAVAHATARIGWDGRGTFSNNVTPHHLAYRQLVFTAFWISVVDEVVAFLNRITADPKIFGDEVFTFELSGLPSVDQLHEAMKAVRDGSGRLTDLSDVLLHPKFARRSS
ncbi:MAG: hypothetical protein NVS3B1_25630 [Marmoricola sp.]